MYVNMSGNNNEIVHEGWLTKSPPSNRIWKARWRRRWFVLRHSGELPGQFYLQYYKDRNCRKLKGTIDLDQCEQVDAGLRFENSKQNFPHMFDVKTPKRTYYLAADSETDMNKWVDCVCQVCGLKSAIDDSSVEFTEESSDSVSTPIELGDMEPPPVTPVTIISGPYIPISECISGKPLNTPLGISDFNNIVIRQALTGSANTNRITVRESYQTHSLMQNNLNNIKQTICDDDISKCDNNKSVTLVMAMPRTSVDRFNSLYGDKNILTTMNCKKDDLMNTIKITNIESAKKMAELKSQGRRPPDLKLTESVSADFYDNPRKIVVDKAEWSPADRESSAPLPNWETFPAIEISEESDFSPGEIGSWSVVQRFGKLTVIDSKFPIVTNSLNRTTKQKAQPDTFSLRRPVAPPRPPKPSHLILQENVHNYLNLEKNNAENGNTPEIASTPNSIASAATIPCDEMYDIPRSHQPQSQEVSTSAKNPSRHNYLNAAPVEMTGNVFIYDFPEASVINMHGNEGNTGEPISPRSEGSGSGAGVIYSNLPSPLNTDIQTPPAVNRELKPTRKMSDSGVSNEPSPGGSFAASQAKETSPGGPFSVPLADALSNGPPSIDRTLKPKKLQAEVPLKLGKPPESSLSLRRVRAGPSPVPQGSSTLPNNIKNGKLRSEFTGLEEDPRCSPENEPIYYFESPDNRYIPAGKKITEIQYIDLDLESDINANPGSAQAAGPTTTVYKTVDFLKTEAFNRTRQEIEEERNNKLPAD